MDSSVARGGSSCIASWAVHLLPSTTDRRSRRGTLGASAAHAAGDSSVSLAQSKLRSVGSVATCASAAERPGSSTLLNNVAPHSNVRPVSAVNADSKALKSSAQVIESMDSCRLSMSASAARLAVQRRTMSELSDRVGWDFAAATRKMRLCALSGARSSCACNGRPLAQMRSQHRASGSVRSCRHAVAASTVCGKTGLGNRCRHTAVAMALTSAAR